MSSRRMHRFRPIAILLVAGQVTLGVPQPLRAAPQTSPKAPEAPESRETPPAREPPQAPPAPPAPDKVKVNRTVPKVTPVPRLPRFSSEPTDEEIFRARLFDEPLVPVLAATTPEENGALARAIEEYLAAGGGEQTAPLEAFLAAHPRSAWRVSLLTNLGLVYRRTGYFSRAVATWQAAWEAGRSATGRRERVVANRAVGELAQLNARLGRYEELQALFREVEGREIGGSAEQKLNGARQGLAVMEDRPEEAFTCGPMALDRILAYEKSDYSRDPKIMAVRGTQKGTSLLQIRDLSAGLGSAMQMAKRETPEARILVPAMVHWKAGHFAAVVDQAEGRFLIHDPTFGEELWISRRAFEEESSGYSLVDRGALPSGWRRVSDDEGAQVFGKGPTDVNNPQNQKCDDKKSGGGGGCNCTCPDQRPANGSPTGMARYAFHTMLVNLNIGDAPLGYTPPRGPVVQFQATYNHREVFQPEIPSYSNLGPKWTHDWLSWIEDDPTQPAQPVNLYVRGGGQETYSGYNAGTQSYAPHFESRAVVIRVSSDPLRYERRMPDGSTQVFEQPDGALAFPRKVFLTQVVDPQGNAMTLTYDSSLRLVAVTDAIGQVTTLAYELAGDVLKITKVTDPFGRFAQLEYEDGRLVRITDVIGMQSEFAYGPGDFITAMTTPYGRTTFERWEEGRRFWLEATDPLGGKERLEYLNSTGGAIGNEEAAAAAPYSLPGAEIPTGFWPGPNGNGTFRNTFFWDKRASALHPGEYTKAKLIHWLHGTSITQTAGVIENERNPLEATRTFYVYPGQSWIQSIGTHAQPNAVGKVMDDGSSQVWQYQYNSLGKVTRATDPLGRATIYNYDTNGIDLLNMQRVNGQSTDLLASYTYNSLHEPLTVTDAAGQTTTYTYNSQGQLLTVVTPPRGGLTAADRTTTYTYDTNGYLQSIVRPAAGATTTYTYDGYGRQRTVTYSDGYSVTLDYDALDRLTKTTYPDGTYEQTVYNRLDPEQHRDRLGRWSHSFYDALRHVVSTRDAAGRTTTRQWCTCGSLDKIIDANGNAITWERDVQGRVTREVRADTSSTTTVYENTTSRVKQRTDAKNQTANYEYFLDNSFKRLSYTNPQNPTPDISFTYDSVYNRVASMTDGTGSTSYSYQPPGSLGAGRVASVDGPLTSDTVSYTYDELGRSATRAVNGVSASWSYDTLGRTTTEVNSLGTFTSTYVGTTPRLDTVTYPNGQATSYTYFGTTGDQRLQDLHNKLPGGATLSRFTYTRDAEGDVATWTQQAGAGAAVAYDFAYDPVEELLAATLRTTGGSPSVLKRYVYGYDKTGNRTSEQIDDAVTGGTYNSMNQLLSTQPGGALRFSGTLNEAATVTVGGTPATVDATNTFQGSAPVPSGSSNVVVAATDASGNLRTNTYQVSASGASKTLTYDANGNLTNDGSRGFEWDANNQLTAVTQGTRRTEFSYDGRGRRTRVLEKDGGSTLTDRQFVWAEVEMVEERDASSGNVLRRFFRHGMQDGGASLYFSRDHLGSVREVSDQTASLVARYDYDPWGRITQVNGTAPAVFGYTGQYSYPGSAGAPQAGLSYYKARYYTADLGRFLSEDPKRAKNSPTFFAYANNNPVNVVDPYGLVGVKCDTCPKPQQPNINKAVSTFCSNANNVKCKMGLKQLGLDKCVDDKCKGSIDVKCIQGEGPDPDQCGGPAFPLLQDATKALYLLPLQFNGPCPSLNFTIAHEIAHMCGIGPDAGPMVPPRTAELNRQAADNIALVCAEP